MDNYDHEQFETMLKDIKERTKRMKDKVENTLRKFDQELDELQEDLP